MKTYWRFSAIHPGLEVYIVFIGIPAIISVLAFHLWRRYLHRKVSLLSMKNRFLKSLVVLVHTQLWRGYRPAFHPLSAPGMLFAGGLQFTWDERFKLYRKIARELISFEPTVWGSPVLYTNSSEVMRQITASTPWSKPEWPQTVASYWGRSVLTTTGREWKKHKRIVQPAFNRQMYEMVWKETTRFCEEMLVADKWPVHAGETRNVERTQTFCQRLALCVILTCAFGIQLSWSDKTNAGEDEFRLDDGIKFQGDNATLMGIVPSWLLHFPNKRFRYIRKSSAALRSWFNTSIASKKSEIEKVLLETNGDIDDPALTRDVFSRLILATHMNAKVHLEDSEIMGNTWVMYFAGHDTIAKVLTAAFCLLSVHKHEQDIVLEEIQKIAKDTLNGELDFEHYEALVKTKSVFVEALRMYPAGTIMIREAEQDTLLHVPCGANPDGKINEETVFIPKGAWVIGDLVGMQYNPRSFPQPEIFRPSRWYDTSTDEAFTAFSVASRPCIGRRFALVEGVYFLAHVLRQFEVLPLLADGEEMEGWKKRVLGRTEMKMTLGIIDSPLCFRRR